MNTIYTNQTNIILNLWNPKRIWCMVATSHITREKEVATIIKSRSYNK
jgi:hypothetical protein